MHVTKMGAPSALQRETHLGFEQVEQTKDKSFPNASSQGDGHGSRSAGWTKAGHLPAGDRAAQPSSLWPAHPQEDEETKTDRREFGKRLPPGSQARGEVISSDTVQDGDLGSGALSWLHRGSR